MWVLALDTTTRDGSVALVRDGDVVVERPSDAAWTHAERLPADLRAVLDEAGVPLTAVDLVAVATGPGAFTGLRIGLAAAQGLALALDRPAAGVPTLAALAWDVLTRHPEHRAAGAWLDATRGEVYAAAFEAGSPRAAWPLVPLCPPLSAPPAAVLEAWHGVVPPGLAVALASPHPGTADLTAAGLLAVAPAAYLAGLVGRIGAIAHAAGGSGPAAALSPEYVRRPDVEIARDRGRGASPAC